MKESAVFFMSPTCGACQSQKKLLNDYFISQGKTSTIKIINVDKYPDKFKYIEVLPTWMFIMPGGKKCTLKSGVLQPEEIFKKRGSRFGKEEKTLYPGINDLEYYGKYFPNGKDFTVTDNYYETVESVWGKGSDALNAGVGGTRSLGPNNIQDMYSTKFLNNIRMAHPADQLGTALYLNRTCNVPQKGSVGMVSNSKNPQIVDNTTGFGRRGSRGRRSRFGNLYSQMGPAFEIENQYLIEKETGDKLYSGARQFETPRPGKVGSGTFIGQASEYNPLTFGKLRKVKKPVKKPVKKSVKKQVKKPFNVNGKKAVNIKISVKR